jgi:hypothetical protein
MAANLHFVPGGKNDTENHILNSFRYVLDKRRDDTSYWKCSDFRNGCRARITTTDKQLTSPIPSHKPLEVQNAKTTVHKAKQNLKRKAADGDQPTKYHVSEAVSSMGMETPETDRLLGGVPHRKLTNPGKLLHDGCDCLRS